MATKATLSVKPVVGSESIENNTSKIKIVLKVTTTEDSYNASGDTLGAVYIDGKEVGSLNQKKFYLESTTTIYSKEHTIKHNADGKKTVDVKTVFNTRIGAGVLTNEVTDVKLPDIPRVAKLSFADFKLGYPGTITINSVSGFKNTITWKFGSKSGTVVTDSTGSSVSWTPGIALAEEMPNDKKKTGTFTVTTKVGSTVAGTDTFTFNMLPSDKVAPTISEFTPEPLSDNATVQNWGELVKGKSRLGYTAKYSGVNGATITKAVISFAGVSGETQTPILTKAGEFFAKLTVTDSRGVSSSKEMEDPLIVREYFSPIMDSSSAFRCDETGKKDEAGSCVGVTAAATIASVVGKNRLTLQARYRINNGSWNGPVTLEEGKVNILKTVTGQNVTLEENEACDVEITAVDLLGKGIPVAYNVPTVKVAFHIMEGGVGAAFGAYAIEEDTLDIAWKTLKVGGKTLLDLIHPVGSLYWSSDPTDPATLFGGTWKRIKDRFILAAGDTYNAEATGGAATVKLTADQLPKLSSTINFRPWGSGSPYVGVSGIVSNYGSIGQTENAFPTSTSSGSLRQLKIAFGNDAAHENMPPYAVKYCWERTA